MRYSDAICYAFSFPCAILAKLPEDEADIINRYIAKSSAVAYKDCAFLYVQGAKDCVINDTLVFLKMK